MYSVPSAAARKECAVPCEKCPSCTDGGIGASKAGKREGGGIRGGVNLESESRDGTDPGTGAGVEGVDGTGSATKSCQRFLPIAHTSSHEVVPMGRP